MRYLIFYFNGPSSLLRWRSLLLASLMLVHITSPGLAADSSSGTASDSVDSVEFELEETSKRLEKLKQEIVQNRALKKELSKSVSSIAAKASERETRLKELSNQVSQYSGKLDELQAMIEEERSGLNVQKQRLAEAMRHSLQITEASGLKIVLQSDDPAQASRLNVYTEYLLLAQHKTINQQLETLKQIEQAHEEALKNRNWAHYLKKKASKQHSAFIDKRDEGKQSLKAVEQSLSNSTRSVAELNADKERLQLLMEELKKAQLAASGYFESGKGKYAMPVQGQIHARFGEIKSVGKLRWNGIYIQAKKGSSVRSIADGEVVYSNFLQGFGMLVIIDHGDSYMTLYGGNKDVRVANGTWVEAGATIATVGDSGGQKNSGLYFEIRQSAKPVNPEEWVGAKNRFRNAKL